VIGALDETGQQKKGEATAAVKRQHLGCAGRVEYCFVPAGELLTKARLIRAAGLRWPVEEGLCATRRSAVFPVQPGGTWREVSGSDG
jgi:hypothetical protein